MEDWGFNMHLRTYSAYSTTLGYSESKISPKVPGVNVAITHSANYGICCQSTLQGDSQ